MSFQIQLKSRLCPPCRRDEMMGLSVWGRHDSHSSSGFRSFLMAPSILDLSSCSVFAITEREKSLTEEGFWGATSVGGHDWDASPSLRLQLGSPREPGPCSHLGADCLGSQSHDRKDLPTEGDVALRVEDLQRQNSKTHDTRRG